MERIQREKVAWPALAARLVLSALLLGLFVLLAAGCSDGRNAASGDTAGEGASGEHAHQADGAAESGGSSPGAGSTADSGAAEDRAARSPDRPAGEPGGAGAQASPGQLTAGEWRDVDEWERWIGLLNGREGDANQRHWAFYRFDRLIVSATGGGQPVADASVVVEDGEGRVVWEARTDADGKAYLFAGLFDGQRRGQMEPGNEPAARGGDGGQERGRSGRGQGGYFVEVRHGSQLKRFDNVPIPRAEPLEAAFAEAAPPAPAVDLMFVVDTTGSMQDEIDFLREELKDVIARVAGEAGQQLRFGVSTNFYRDKYDDYIVKPYPFTENIDQAVRQIAEQRASGGGDYPEAVDEALDDALHEHEWSREARARLLFLVLDAPPHHEPDVVERLHEQTRAAAARGIRIVPVASSGVDVQTEYLMRFLAASTGGTYVFLTDHSGIGNDHLEPAVGEYEVRPLNELLADIILRYTLPGSE